MISTTGCSGGGPSMEVLERSNGVKVIVAGGSGGGMDARLEGSLAVLAGDCLGIEVDGTSYLIAWPEGTSVSTDGDLVLSFDDDEYALGDDVTVTGGAVQTAESSAVPELPSSCDEEEIFVVNG